MQNDAGLALMTALLPAHRIIMTEPVNFGHAIHHGTMVQQLE